MFQTIIIIMGSSSDLNTPYERFKVFFIIQNRIGSSIPIYTPFKVQKMGRNRGRSDSGSRG